MLRKKEPNGNVVNNPKCVWCNGSGWTPVPDYDAIGRFGWYSEIMAGRVPQNATKACYCHQCYPEAPMRDKTHRYPNLLTHINAAKRTGQDMDILLAVLHFGFAMRDRKAIAGQHIASVMHGNN